MTLTGLASTRFEVEFHVRMELGDPATLPPPGVWGTSQWGTAAWGTTADAYMIDVSEYVEQITTRNGRQRYVGRFRTGTCSVILDNENGEWTPGAGAPLPGFLPLRPGRLIEITAIYDGGEYPVYSGVIDNIGDSYQVGAPYTTLVTGIDLLGLAAVNNTIAVTSVGAGEASSQRMARILAHHFDPPPHLEILGLSAGTSAGFGTSMLATTLAQDALQEMQITADSEGGGVWIQPDGTVAFSLSEYFADRAAGPPDWAVGFPAGVGVVRQDRTEWSLQGILNETHMARVGGTEQVADNSGSRSLFERRTHRRLDLQTDDDAHVAYLGQRIVTNLAAARPRVQGLTLQPDNHESFLVGLLGGIGDVVLLNVSAALSGWSYALKTQIFGIEHTITPGRWRVGFLVDDTEIETRGAFSAGFSDGFDVG